MTTLTRLCATGQYVQGPLSREAHILEALFWRREAREQHKRFLDAGGDRWPTGGSYGTDFAQHNTCLDAEYARDEAERLYRKHKEAAETAVSELRERA